MLRSSKGGTNLKASNGFEGIQIEHQNAIAFRQEGGEFNIKTNGHEHVRQSVKRYAAAGRKEG